MSAALWKHFEGQWIENTYRLERLIGVGGFGAVFLAEHIIEGAFMRKVAIKLVSPEPEHIQRQLGELLAATTLHHPYLLSCYHAGSAYLDEMKLLYLVMELAEETLDQRLQRGLLTPEEARVVAEHVAAAILYLHGQRQVHRDLKPENILRVGDTWKLSDFGALRQSFGQTTSHTRFLVGTLTHMPPEAYSGVVSPAWDMWSLGVILLEILTGREPYEGTTEHELMGAVMTKEPSIPDGLPAPFDAIVHGCLKRDHRTRWTASQLLSAQWSKGPAAEPEAVPVPLVEERRAAAPVDPPPPKRRPRRPWVYALLATPLLAAGAYWGLRAGSSSDGVEPQRAPATNPSPAPKVAPPTAPASNTKPQSEAPPRKDPWAPKSKEPVADPQPGDDDYWRALDPKGLWAEYVQRFPTGKHVAVARQKLREREEQQERARREAELARQREAARIAECEQRGGTNCRPRVVSYTETLSSPVLDIYFDSERSALRVDSLAPLAQDADVLKRLLLDNPGVTISVEGHTDDRRSAEIALALGYHRANLVKEELVKMGVPSGRLRALSYGKERPVCTDSTPECRQKNNRVHFGLAQ